MSAHFWLFPWLALFVSFSAASCAFIFGREKAVTSSITRIETPYIIVWLASTALLVAGALEIGNWGQTDYIPARGVLIGPTVGIALAACIRRKTLSPAGLTTTVIGIVTAIVAASRLWLTHGEVSGLISAGLSAAVSILCLVYAPSYQERDGKVRLVAALTISYMAIAITSALLGFTRAGTLGDLYWADIPLLIGAALSVGSLIATVVEKFGILARTAVLAVVTGLVVVAVALTVAHSLPIIGLFAFGALATGVSLALHERSGNPNGAILLGQLLNVAGVTLAFTLLAGYGIAIYALGVVFTAVVAATGGVKMPVAWLAFLGLLLIYRLEILQNGSSVRAIGLADLWDLLAVGLGALLPRLVLTYLPVSGASGMSWAALLQWLVTLSVPTLMLDYIWQPRSLTGLFLGLAIGQIVAAVGENDDALAITSLIAGFLLFVFLPGLDTLGAPDRTIRIVAISAVAALIVVRILVPNKTDAPKAV